MTDDLLMYWLTVIGFVVGIIGLVIALYQTVSARKLRTLYEEKCTTRSKDISSLVADLNDVLADACQFAGEQCANEKGCSRLTAKIDSAMVINRQLIRFCERLNDEHKYEFGYFVDPNLSKNLRRGSCIEVADK